MLFQCRPLKKNLNQQDCQVLKYQEIHEATGKLLNLEILSWYDSCYKDIHTKTAYQYLIFEKMLERADQG